MRIYDYTYVCIFWMTISSRIMSFHKIFSTHIWYLFFAWVMRNGNWVSQKPVLIDPKSVFILKASLTWPLTSAKESIRQRGWSSIATKVSNVDNQVEVMVAKNQSLNVQFKFLNWFKLFSKNSDSYLLQVALNAKGCSRTWIKSICHASLPPEKLLKLKFKMYLFRVSNEIHVI